MLSPKKIMIGSAIAVVIAGSVLAVPIMASSSRESAKSVTSARYVPQLTEDDVAEREFLASIAGTPGRWDRLIGGAFVPQPTEDDVAECEFLASIAGTPTRGDRLTGGTFVPQLTEDDVTERGFLASLPSSPAAEAR